MRYGILLFLAFLLFSAVMVVDFGYSENTEENLIYIRSDGSVEPPSAPIERIGNIYKFTNDIQASIVIEKDNTVLDGAGFALQGTNASDYRPAIPEFDFDMWLNRTIVNYDETILPQSNNTGIYSYKQKLTIMNLKITSFWCAIELEDSSDNCITDNEIVDNTQGVWIHSSSNNTISRNNINGNKQGLTLTAAYSRIHYNNIINNSEYGIKLYWSFNNLSGNVISRNGYGVSFVQSTRNVFRNNSFDENNRLFYHSGLSPHEFIQDVDISNQANGGTIYFWENKKDLSVPIDAGYVALINCTRIRVENLNLTLGQQILLISTKDSTVTKNMITHNQVCIYLNEATNNIISENILTNSDYGIILEDCTNNQIIFNNFTDNFEAIELSSSHKINIQNNQITNNHQGIRLVRSTNNNISMNNLTLNDIGLYFSSKFKTMNMSDKYNSTIIYGCSNNNVLNNQITDNNSGIYLTSITNNTFSGNNFIGNVDHIKIRDSTNFLENSGFDLKQSRFASINTWDHNQIGNYWSNYNGTNIDRDGIGDTPYVIDENNQDKYPLMNLFEEYSEPIPPKDDDDKLPPIDKFIKQFGVVTVLALLSAIIVMLSLYWLYTRKKQRRENE